LGISTLQYDILSIFHSDPTPAGHSIPNVEGRWEPFTESGREVFHIDRPSRTLRDLDMTQIAFWDGYLQQVFNHAIIANDTAVSDNSRVASVEKLREFAHMLDISLVDSEENKN